MKLAIVLSRLADGGLERVQSNLAGAFSDRGLDLTIVAGKVLRRHDGDFPPDVPVVEISRPSKWFFPIGLYRYLKRECPDCIFTTSNDVACLALLFKRIWFPRVKVIVTQHLSVSAPLNHARGLKRAKLRVTQMLMRRTLVFADGIIAVSLDVAIDLASFANLQLDRIEVIHNPIVGRKSDEMMAAPAIAPWAEDRRPTLVYAGRLSQEKRLDLLLDSFIGLRATLDARLLILGDGPLRASLQNRIDELGISHACIMPGFIDNIFPFIRAADLLVLPSDFEGFGNVLVEAMACGVQVVATDCPHGPSEVLESGRFGQLVPPGDAVALEAAIRRSLSKEFWIDPDVLRHRASQFGVTVAADRYLEVASGTAQPKFLPRCGEAAN